jgi:TolB protein
VGRQMGMVPSRRYAVAAISALLVFAIVASAAHATFPGQNGRISFTRYLPKSDSSQIFTANPDGSDLKQITAVPKRRSAVFSDWSPDGRMIAYDTNAVDADRLKDVVQVYVANADGSGVVQLTRGLGFHADAAWSPDAASLAVEADWGEYPALEGIWVIPASDPDGVTVGDARRLTATPKGFAYDSEPQYSPDGNSIVFTRFKNPERSAIFRINLDGTGLTQLTSYKLNASNPDWSPDGQTIAFDSNDGAAAGSAGNIYSIHPDGSGLTRLTGYKKLKRKGPFKLANNPVWSPAGTQIMFTLFLDKRTKLTVIAADGSGQSTVPLSGKNFDNRVDWGPLPTP